MSQPSDNLPDSDFQENNNDTEDAFHNHQPIIHIETYFDLFTTKTSSSMTKTHENENGKKEREIDILVVVCVVTLVFILIGVIWLGYRKLEKFQRFKRQGDSIHHDDN